MSKQTIEQQVIAEKEFLLSCKTTTELYSFARGKGWDTRQGFPHYKRALAKIGIDYKKMLQGGDKKVEERDVTHELTLYTDAKASAGRFSICDRLGEPIWYGNFFDGEMVDEQSDAELAAGCKAVWLAGKIKEELKLSGLELTLITDAQWMTYQSHNKQKGYKLTQQAQRYGIRLKVQWISGKQNPADRNTTGGGYKKWQDNDLKKLVTLI